MKKSHKKQQDLTKKVVPKDNKAAKQNWQQRRAEQISEAEQQQQFCQIVKKDEDAKENDYLNFSPKAQKKDYKKQQSLKIQQQLNF